MAHAVSPDDMREFLASGTLNRKHDNKLADTVAASVVNSDPEMTQVVATAALCYASKHFDEFAKELELDRPGKSLVKLWLTSVTSLSANGAHVMRQIREDFSE